MSLSGLDLRHPDLTGATLAGARLHDAELTGADLGARLVRPRLTGVRLTGSRWHPRRAARPALDEATQSAPELTVAAIPGREPAEPVLLPPRDTVHDVAWSPDGTLLAVADGSHVLILAAADLRVLRVLLGHTGKVRQVAFSPGGHLLASGDKHGIVRIWDAAAHTLIATIVEFETGWGSPAAGRALQAGRRCRGRLWWAMNLHRFEPHQIDGLDPSVRRLDRNAPLPGLDRYHQ